MTITGPLLRSEPSAPWSFLVLNHQGRPWKVAPVGPGRRDSPSIRRGQSPLWSLQQAGQRRGGLDLRGTCNTRNGPWGFLGAGKEGRGPESLHGGQMQRAWPRRGPVHICEGRGGGEGHSQPWWALLLLRLALQAEGHALCVTGACWWVMSSQWGSGWGLKADSLHKSPSVFVPQSPHIH